MPILAVHPLTEPLLLNVNKVFLGGVTLHNCLWVTRMGGDCPRVIDYCICDSLIIDGTGCVSPS